MIKFLDKINEFVGNVFSYTAFILVLIISIDVIFRYLFNSSFIWITELESYFFAMLFLFSSGYAFKHGSYVRVDVFYVKLSEKGKALVDLIGGIFLLAPWVILTLIYSYKFTSYSFGIRESSSQPGGLPAVYILKSFIFISFVLLSLQGISSILKSLKTLFSKK